MPMHLLKGIGYLHSYLLYVDRGLFHLIFPCVSPWIQRESRERGVQQFLYP